MVAGEAGKGDEGRDVSYLSDFHYTAAVRLILTGALAGLSHSCGMAVGSFILRVVLLSYRRVVTRK